MNFDKHIIEQLEELINEIGDVYEEPEESVVDKFNKLTKEQWTAEDLYMYCCEYWSHNSLEETAYALMTGDYPEKEENEVCFWKEEHAINVADDDIWMTYRLGRYKEDNINITENICKINIDDILNIVKECSDYVMEDDDNDEDDDLKFYYFQNNEIEQYGFKYKFLVSIYNEQVININFENVDYNIQEKIKLSFEKRGFKYIIPQD